MRWVIYKSSQKLEIVILGFPWSSWQVEDKVRLDKVRHVDLWSTGCTLFLLPCVSVNVFSECRNIFSFTDSLPSYASFSTPTQSRAPPRLFCDICDVFDLHDTEDCPKQATSDSPEPTRHHGDPKNTRPYCDICEGKIKCTFHIIFLLFHPSSSQGSGHSLLISAFQSLWSF